METIAIVGAGPAGASLATWLARAGKRVVLFDLGKRPPLIVGESLIPAVMPYLFDLDVVDEVKGYSTLKPGATFFLDQGRVVHQFRFDTVADAKCTYAYNVPRDKFDATLLAAAARAGATVIQARAKVEQEPGTDRVRLSDETLALAEVFGGRQPDWILDATGRTRTVAKLLDLPFATGPRKDAALFAHCAGVPVVDEGHVHTEAVDAGWAWRIPLADRMSVGFVLPADRLREHGETDEARYDNLLARDSVASKWGAGATRLTPVIRYNNWSLLSRRAVGANWALVGDAFGFVDPVFSSGMMIALASASDLAEALIQGGGKAAAMRRYERLQTTHVGGWQEAVEYFYNGQLWGILEVGTRLRDTTTIGRLVAPHFEKNIPKVFTGEAARSPHALRLIRWMCRYGLTGFDYSKYVIRA